MDETKSALAKWAGQPSFAPLTPEALAEAAARRAAGEAEIERKEAALAEAQGRLAETRAGVTALQAELDGLDAGEDDG